MLRHLKEAPPLTLLPCPLLQSQLDNENLQSKLHGLVTARQQDRQLIGTLEKKVRQIFLVAGLAADVFYVFFSVQVLEPFLPIHGLNGVSL